MREWWEDWGPIVLIVTVVTLFVVGALGFAIHTPCSKNCNGAPAYYYNIPIYGMRYSSTYGTSDDGTSIHTSSSSSDDEPGVHSSSSSSEEEAPPEPHISVGEP